MFNTAHCASVLPQARAEVRRLNARLLEAQKTALESAALREALEALRLKLQVCPLAATPFTVSCASRVSRAPSGCGAGYALREQRLDAM